mgnify:CR=1 FL=1
MGTLSERPGPPAPAALRGSPQRVRPYGSICGPTGPFIAASSLRASRTVLKAARRAPRSAHTERQSGAAKSEACAMPGCRVVLNLSLMKSAAKGKIRSYGPTRSYLQTRVRASRLLNAVRILALLELSRRLHQAYRQAYDKQAADWLLPQNSNTPQTTDTPQTICHIMADIAQDEANDALSLNPNNPRAALKQFDNISVSGT